MKLSKLKLNDANPRTITDVRFRQLVNSIKDFPKMMRLNPITVNRDYMILAGNMRYRACLELGMKEIPDDWVQVADDLTPEEERRYIIEDNVLFGDWDWDRITNEWDERQLADWGLDYPSFMVTDVPRPDFDDTALDKGKSLNAKDGNWFYVEYYGQDELFAELRAALEAAGVLISPHQLDPDVFMQAMHDWAKQKTT